MLLEDDLYHWFVTRELHLEHREHEATATVADAARVKGALPAGHSKSLLVEEKGGGLTLICARGEMRVNLIGIAKNLGTRRFSFASEEKMISILGVRPGSLSPLALIHDRARQIARVILDAGLINEPMIWCHPLRNTASVGMSPNTMMSFINAHHGEPVQLDIAHPNSDG